MGWSDLHPSEGPHVVEDMWTDPPKNHYPYEKPGRDGIFWKWSVVSRNQAHIWGSSVVHGSRSPDFQFMGLGGEQGPIENKGKRSTGTSAPIQPEGYPWKRATESELGLPEVIVVAKVRYPSGKEYVRENTTNLSEKNHQRSGSRPSGPLPRELFEDEGEWEKVSEPADDF